MNKAIIISAPSGSGKTTIIKRLLSTNLPIELSVSACSRPKRENEVEGKDYFFITVDMFKEKIKNNEFIEWEEVYEGCFYGTLKSEIERIWKNNKAVIFDVDVKGGVNLKKYFGDKSLSLFIKPPSIEELKRRLINRGTETEETLNKRIERANYELTFESYFDVVVVNDSLELAFEKVLALIKEFLNK